jgi:hypothetical protein
VSSKGYVPPGKYISLKIGYEGYSPAAVLFATIFC